jgi:hypothetical protein
MGRLGTAAEVLTAEAPKGDQKRPIAVYTADFDDLEEISRVLESVVS